MHSRSHKNPIGIYQLREIARNIDRELCKHVRLLYMFNIIRIHHLHRAISITSTLSLRNNLLSLLIFLILGNK